MLTNHRLVACTLAIVPPVLGGCVRSSHPDWIATSRHAMVASDHTLASQAGLDILRAGGNAVDAAIAVSLTLAVTRPESTGLGGGGFMIVRMADGSLTGLDYRETAPAAADAEMYIRASAAHPERASPSRFGHLAAGTPGLLAGLAEAHRRFGTLDWEILGAPAQRIAASGFAVDEHYVSATRGVLARYQQHPELKESCPYVYDEHLRCGNLRQPGEILRQPQLVRAMRQICALGADGFIDTSLADALAAEMKTGNGLITADDLRNYRVAVRNPLCGTYRGCEIIAMPPPSSGGICLIEALNILETLPMPRLARTDPALAIHYRIEAMKHAFADRARWLGDADFVPVPTGLLTAKPYAKTLSTALRPDATLNTDTYGAIQIPDDSGTSHFCIVDRWGNCVVSTETINTSFGSLAAVAEWGIILNNEMDDFTAEPGTANFFGLQQSQRNAVAPGKRPLSSMCPTIVVRGEKPLLLLGASGGPRIISSVLNVMLNLLDADLPLDRALTALRPHHQWQPDEVFFDREPDDALRRALEARGHTLSPQRRSGVVQAIEARGRGWVGASDPRKGGRPAGN